MRMKEQTSKNTRVKEFGQKLEIVSTTPHSIVNTIGRPYVVTHGTNFAYVRINLITLSICMVVFHSIFSI